MRNEIVRVETAWCCWPAIGVGRLLDANLVQDFHMALFGVVESKDASTPEQSMSRARGRQTVS